MKIKRIISQHRRDFQAIYECQHCGHEENGGGYDDANFHENVIPKIPCSKCGKAGDEVTSAATVHIGGGVEGHAAQRECRGMAAIGV